VKTIVRTKSGRLIEKTIMVSKEEYDELQRIAREGGDPASVLNKYMGKDEKVEGWKKVEAVPKAMKVVKTMVRTKSGRLVRVVPSHIYHWLIECHISIKNIILSSTKLQILFNNFTILTYSLKIFVYVNHN